MLVYAHLTQAPPSVTAERPGLEGIDDVVATALAKRARRPVRKLW